MLCNPKTFYENVALIKTLLRNTNIQYIADDIIYQQLSQRKTATGRNLNEHRVLVNKSCSRFPTVTFQSYTNTHKKLYYRHFFVV
jgi:hypothetical protein